MTTISARAPVERPITGSIGSVSSAASPNHRVAVAELLETDALGNTPRVVMLLCALCVLIDGADFQIMGFVAPAIMKALAVSPATMGIVFASGIVGMMVGSIALAPLADHAGRRPVLIGSLLAFAIAMALTAAATAPWQLLALRFVTGLGLGSVMPISTSLTGEYTPPSRRVARMILVSTSFPLGAVGGGLCAAALLPAFGWRSVFAVGGIVPAALAALVYLLLPESLDFLATRGRHAEIRTLLRKGNGSASESEMIFLSTAVPERPSVQRLFDAGRARTTTLLWSLYALNLLMLMFLSSWLPTLVTSMGRSPREAILTGTVLQLGGALGAVCMQRLIGGFGPRYVLTGAFCISAAALLLIGLSGLPIAIVFLLVAVAGFTVVGGQQVLNGLAAYWYPTHLRATGAGWAMGIGRLGSVIGPVLAGVLLGARYGYATLLQLAAIPALLSAGLMFLLGERRHSGAAPIAQFPIGDT